MATTEILAEPTPRARTDNRKSRDLKRKLLRLGTFVLFQLILALGLLEVVARVADPFGISYYPETARYLETMIIEEPIGYRNQPNLRGRFHGATYSINSQGLRNEEVAEVKQPNEYRFLMLGDSVVFGLGVEDDETIPCVVERLANQNAASGKQIRVINMGVPSYNTEQERIQFLSLGMSLKPDAVVLLNSINDIETKMWVFEKRASTVINLAQRSYAACLLFKLRRQMQESFGKPPELISEGDYEKGNVRWQSIDDSLTAINDACRDANIPFLLLVNGPRDQKPFHLHFEVAQRESFAIDTVNPWIDDRWKDLDGTKFVNSQTDQHANRDGCVIHGTHIYELITKHAMIP